MINSTTNACGLVTDESVLSISTSPLEVRFSFRTIRPLGLRPNLIDQKHINTFKNGYNLYNVTLYAHLHRLRKDIKSSSVK